MVTFKVIEQNQYSKMISNLQILWHCIKSISYSIMSLGYYGQYPINFITYNSEHFT